MTSFLILSKIFTFLISPVNWIFFLLLWRYLAVDKIWKKRLLTSAIIIFFVFSNEFILVQVMKAWQPQKRIVQQKSFEVGIVLGGFTSFDKNDNGYFSNSADRFIQTFQLYRLRVIKKIIVSGGSVWQNERSESDFVKEQLILCGVKNEDIIAEGRSRNTFENAKYSKRILDSLKSKGPVLVITSAIHVPRAVSLFTKAGVDIVSYPCDYKVIDKKMYLADFLVPDFSALDKWALLLKEVVGLGVYTIAGRA